MEDLLEDLQQGAKKERENSKIEEKRKARKNFTVMINKVFKGVPKGSFYSYVIARTSASVIHRCPCGLNPHGHCRVFISKRAPATGGYTDAGNCQSEEHDN